MNRNTKIAAAIAAVLGTAAGTALANDVPPTTADASSTSAVSLYIAGSSAAKNAITGALYANLCGASSNALTVASTSNKNFLAVSCTPATGTAGADGNTYYTVYYRSEGGSVVGALPIVNNDQVKQLDLTAVTCAASATTCNPTVVGTSSANGIDDSFSTNVVNQPVQLGILDVEPAALATANNYPFPYSTGAWGANNQAGLVTLGNTTNSGRLFDQVFAIYVNEGSGTANFTENPLSLSTETVALLLSKGITNWNQVTDTSGNTVISSSLAVTIVNREQGSGSRTATDLLIAGDTCQNGGTNIKESKSTNVDYFATGDVLGAANSVLGAITYASIDNAATGNMSIVKLNGVAPSSLAAATGTYPFWAEATYALNANVTLSSAQTSLVNYLLDKVQTEATAPHLAQVVMIPSLVTALGNTVNTPSANTAGTADTAVSGSPLGAATIYVNRFTRGKKTCSAPTY